MRIELKRDRKDEKLDVSQAKDVVSEVDKAYKLTVNA